MRYQFVLALRDETQLRSELLALVPALPGFDGAIFGSGVNLFVDTTVDLSPADLTRLTNAVAAHAPNPAFVLAALHARASNYFDVTRDEAYVTMRAIVLALLKEVNILRQRDRDRTTDIAASTSLANLQTRWAARPPLADRTAAQAKQAVRDSIAAGEAD